MIRFCKNLFHLFSAVTACLYFHFPGTKMTVIGVTGTDGKTTTVHLIYEILKKAGKKVSMISTIAAIINGKSFDTGFHVSTPSPWALQKFMRQAFDGGTNYFVLEVTSHALDQYRTEGSSIDIGVITNISHEHLDYHQTFNNYLNSKAKILNATNLAVLNKDDPNFDYLRKKAANKLITFSLKQKADYTLKNAEFRTKLPGQYNLYNCLAAFAVARELNIDEKIIIDAIAKFSGIPGRMEQIKNTCAFNIFIDFAHKPNALEQALKTARSISKKKLIVVFGCAGLRDRLKRPMMGAIAAKYADYIVLTAEDPRTEDVRNINDQIASGCLKEKIIQADKSRNFDGSALTRKKYFWKIADRQEAINFAIRKLAKKGDTVLITGKGHEKSMCYGTTEYPWNEKIAVAKALYDSVKSSPKI
ncbi:UDP-N-acetylmuramoyl-L-alanyl-D-glutamate--2,6-diaminopimelate ligase [Candidatus Gottesmanbacteria bacterium]|nr:UDP-N-acetylmuramoyl-L-alanyl-D-glutamate--2,6-diaminopimelate ligase [Candidatus Gottesmanbacteria bacterium]